MNDWQPIETAPHNGTHIMAKIPGHGGDNIIAWADNFVDENEVSCGGWYFVNDNKEPPPSWCDGVCWESNSYGKPSVPPTFWKPLK